MTRTPIAAYSGYLKAWVPVICAMHIAGQNKRQIADLLNVAGAKGYWGADTYGMVLVLVRNAWLSPAARRQMAARLLCDVIRTYGSGLPALEASTNLLGSDYG